MARRRSLFSRIFDYLRAFVLLAAVAVVAAFLTTFLEREDRGRFVAVDGDSLRRGETRFRLQGIDAPELNQQCERSGEKWACGRASRDALRQRIQGREIVCTSAKNDQYGRRLATCKVEDEVLNAWMVRSGWAVAYGSYSREQRDAEKEGRGIWAGDFTAPRDWRRENLQPLNPIFSWIGGWMNKGEDGQ